MPPLPPLRSCAVVLLLLAAAVPLAFASQSAAAQGLITTSLQGNTLASVNLTTNPFQVQTIFDTPSGAGMAVVQPDGRILYTMPPAGQLGRFDPTTNTNEILVSGFGEPRELTMEPSGTSVLVSDHGGEMIYRINLVNCPPSPGSQCPTTVLVNGPAEGVYNPEGITYDAAGNLYAVFQQQSVRQVDPGSGAILNSYIFPVNNHLEGLTYDTSTNSLWVAARDVNGLYELPLDLSSATPVQQANTGTCQLPTGCIPTANGVTSDGTGILYIAAQGDYHLYQYKIASDALIQENYIYGVYGVATGTGAQPTTLAFPVKQSESRCGGTCTPFTVNISAIFDHEMARAYESSDDLTTYPSCTPLKNPPATWGEIMDFEGEVASSSPAIGSYGLCGDLHGYTNPQGTSYLAGYNLRSPTYLYYDGHPGYDYPFEFTGKIQTGVYPALSGCVTYKLNAAGASAGPYHVMTIIPQSKEPATCAGVQSDTGFTIAHLHLSSFLAADGTVRRCIPTATNYACGTTIPCPKCAQEGQWVSVSSADPIAYVGDFAFGKWHEVGSHLHFEVDVWIAGKPLAIDPYGWNPITPGQVDPYSLLHPRVVNSWLWSSAP